MQGHRTSLGWIWPDAIQYNEGSIRLSYPPLCVWTLTHLRLVQPQVSYHLCYLHTYKRHGRQFMNLKNELPLWMGENDAMGSSPMSGVSHSGRCVLLRIVDIPLPRGMSHPLNGAVLPPILTGSWSHGFKSHARSVPEWTIIVVLAHGLNQVTWVTCTCVWDIVATMTLSKCG